MNPLFIKEKIQNSRKNTLCFLILGLHLFLLLLLQFVGLATDYASERSGVNGFAISAYALFLFLFLYVPIRAGSSVSGERERGQLEFLLASGLTVSSFLTGKLVSCVVETCVLLVSTLPVFGGLMVFGGLHLYYVCNLAFFLFSVTVFLAAMGIYASCIFRNSIRSVVSTYLAFLLLTGLSLLICYSFVGTTMLNQGQSLILSMALQLGNPALALVTLCAQCTGNQLQVLKILQQVMILRSGFYYHYQWLFSACFMWAIAIWLFQKSIRHLKEHPSF